MFNLYHSTTVPFNNVLKKNNLVAGLLQQGHGQLKNGCIYSTKKQSQSTKFNFKRVS